MIILGTNSIKDTGYDVGNSVRMSGATVNLQRDFSGDGNRRTWTYSTWFKLSNIKQSGFFNWGKGNPEFSLRFESTTSNASLNQFRVSQYDNSQIFDLVTTQYFRDPSAWGHMVVAFDTTQGTASNRIKIYFNGTQITSFSTETYPDQNFETFVNQASKKHYIGYADYQPINGYLCETVFIDGQQLAPDQLGEFDEDSGIWKPIDVSGLTFGTNGYYLQYKEAGTSQNASGIGADTSGGTNHFACDDVVATDQSTDTCTNNFMTLNPLITLTSVTDNQVYSEGNTIVIPNSTDNYGTAFGTFGATKGKWYWEAQIIWNGTSNNANFPKQIGFMREDYAFNKSYLGQNDDQTWGVGFADLSTDGWGLDHNGSFSAISGATTLADDKMVMFALDLDNGKFYMGYDGTFFTSGDPTSGATGTGAIATLDATDLSFTIIPALTNATNTTHYKMNFGNPAYAIASSNADGNGYGNFEFAVPSGYFSWCSKNLAEYG